ncbi:uncharacterized protein LOC116181630 [Photinus pyralis]|uniref:uncharacterized protein LOC116168011 n=1 Tax=Photinus pyralis TaxID=7054 RepID=UPI0012673FAB|nr:uncharacterized protein LOC116168011 [Photinus pyralis]XP_031357872.1 uncharacterized protein LOC116181630 [Photinus pyralis]
MRRIHFKSLKGSFVRNKDTLCDINDVGDVEVINNLDSDEDYNPVVVGEGQPNNNYEELSLKLISSLYLTMESKYFMTNKSMQIVIDGITDLNKLNNDYIIEKLKTNNVVIDKAILENNLFDKVHNAVHGELRSKFIRNKYYQNYFNYISPKCINLEGGSKFYYVPIIKTIEMLFKTKNFCKAYFSPESNVEDFSNICDGISFKNNLFYENNPHALQLILYQDAFEICNPLGSSRKKHKVVGIYFTVNNIPSRHWSKVGHIQLIGLVYEKTIKMLGFHKVLTVLLEDLKFIEVTGVEVEVDNKRINIKGSLLSVIGDNLGSHQVGGFVENFSTSGYFCRYCDFSYAHSNKPIVYRTKSLYEFDVNMANFEAEPSKGIKHNSVLNDLNYYHVCNPGLPPCIAHDMFEGVVQRDLMLAINQCVSNKLFSYDELNIKVSKLHFLFEKKYTFPLLSKGDKLPGNASQNMMLLLLFPFVFHDDDNLHVSAIWKLILCLRRICLLLLSFKISLNQVALLKTLITEYLEDRQTLFPNVSLKPKHHFMSHYPYLTRQFGPLRHLWTLRFEAKHQYFKNAIRHSKNYKNILFSLSNKHQLFQALNATQNLLFNDSVLSDDAHILGECEVSYEMKNLITTNIGNIDILISNYVTFRGTIYKTGQVVCYDIDAFGYFLLCKIQFILITKEYDDIYFVGQKTKIFCNYYNDLFYQFADETEINIFVKFNSLLCHEPLLQYLSTTKTILYSFKSTPYVV